MIIGETIGHYQILEELGRGGMGIVYKARDLTLDRVVALKFLPRQVTATDEERARFMQEARAASALNHPNVCGIHSIGEHEGETFIDMEFVDGKTLRRRITEGARLPDGQGIRIEEAIEFAVQIAEALQEAHNKGIVHRDIKSDNIIVTEKNQIKVMDFGLAKLRGSVDLTRAGTTVGTMSYMAPEQIQGLEADARSDIFSFAVVLYEMLTGQLPFRGEHEAALMYMILNEDPPQLQARRADIPADVATVVDKALEKDRTRRYQTARQLIDDLKRVRPKQYMNHESEKPSIAVMAFKDMSPEKDQDYFCEGLAEELINTLTRVGTLHVAARTSAFSFKGKQEDIREIGRKLGVRTVLDGSVRKAGNRLRITATLSNTADGYQVWSERYDRDLRDVFEIQDEITGNITRALKVVLSPQDRDSMASRRTKEVEAYEYYLRGRKLFYEGLRGSHEEALKMYRRATEIDPKYALAYTGIADSYCMLFMYWESSSENLSGAESASREALELDPGLAEAHSSRGFSLMIKKKYSEAEREFETAITLNPMLFEGYFFYARCCFEQGKHERAAQLFSEASRVRPEDYQCLLLSISPYRMLGDEARREEAQRRGMEVVRRHLELNPNDVRALYLGGCTLIDHGDRDEGLRWIERAHAMQPGDPAVLYNIPCGYALAGEVEKSLDCLENAVRNGFSHRAWIENDPDLESIRKQSRYQQLIERLK